MRIGIDSHAAERDGSGNCTYIRGLISGLAEIDDRNEYFLYAIDAGHPFYDGLTARANFRLRTLGPRNPFFRIPFSLAKRTFSDRLDVLYVQYIAPPVHRRKLVITIHDLA